MNLLEHRIVLYIKVQTGNKKEKNELSCTMIKKS